MALDRSLTWRPADVSTLDLHGTRVAVVGGTGGLGRAISRLLAEHGAKILVVGQTFRDADVAGIEFLAGDLSLMREADRVARALPAEDLDVLLLTTGIFAASNRQETAEGLERDMAVSYLSRLVILRAVADRLRERRPGVKPRVFVMGYPGSGQAGTHLDDLNAERQYGSMWVHMNTVAGNEALVLHSAKRYPHVNFYGLNPGLVATNIRSNMLGADTWRFRIVEGMISLFAPTPDKYAARIAPLLVAPELEGRSGAMFDQKGRAILPTPELTAARAGEFLAASEALVARANAAVRS